MSRTDKTQPLLVKLWDGTLRRQAFHDHRTGPCDLPSTLREHLLAGPTRCTWDLHFDGTYTCSCEICKAHTWVRNDVRSERRRNRIELGELLKEARVGNGIDS